MKKTNKFLVLMMTIFVIFFIILDFNSYASMTTFPGSTTDATAQTQQQDVYNGILPTDDSKQVASQYLGVDANSVAGIPNPLQIAPPSIEIIPNDTKSKLVELKNNELTTLKEYQEAYGGTTYGLVAFILNKVRVYSIPFCILGIAISSIYQYIVGHRQLEYRDKGFNAMVSMVTILVICQVLPLVFAIVVKGWRN